MRGILLAGQFRTQHELDTMSADDQRNTLIVELAGGNQGQPRPSTTSTSEARGQ